MINGIMVLVLAIVVLAIVASATARMSRPVSARLRRLAAGTLPQLGALVSEPRLLVVPHAVPGLTPLGPQPAGTVKAATATTSSISGLISR